jgi:hypothetical protein
LASCFFEAHKQLPPAGGISRTTGPASFVLKTVRARRIEDSRTGERTSDGCEETKHPDCVGRRHRLLEHQRVQPRCACPRSSTFVTHQRSSRQRLLATTMCIEMSRKPRCLTGVPGGMGHSSDTETVCTWHMHQTRSRDFCLSPRTPQTTPRWVTYRTPRSSAFIGSEQLTMTFPIGRRLM